MKRPVSHRAKKYLKAYKEALEHEMAAQYALDMSHLVPHDPHDEDDAFRARKQAERQREIALKALFKARDELREARGVYQSASRPPPRGSKFYVTAVFDGRTALLAGPFNTHVEALRMLPAARDKAKQVAPREAPFAHYGTAAVRGSRKGKLNELLGI